MRLLHGFGMTVVLLAVAVPSAAAPVPKVVLPLADADRLWQQCAQHRENSLRFPGLADIEALGRAYDGARSGQNEVRSGSGRGAVGPWSVGGRGGESSAEPTSTRVPDESSEESSETHCSAPMRKRASYVQAVAAASLAAGV